MFSISKNQRVAFGPVFVGIFLALLLIVLVGCPSANSQPDNLGLSGEDSDLVGTWSGNWEVNGQVAGTTEWTFTSDGRFETVDNAGSTMSGIFGVDTSTDPPKIDMVFENTIPFIDGVEGELREGVYTIDFIQTPRHENYYLHFTLVDPDVRTRPLSPETGPNKWNLSRSP